MHGVDEVHLLNHHRSPAHLRQGWARRDAGRAGAVGTRRARAVAVAGGARGQCPRHHVYEHYGFRRVGERKRYYPAGDSQREDAIVMSYKL